MAHEDRLKLAHRIIRAAWDLYLEETKLETLARPIRAEMLRAWTEAAAVMLSAAVETLRDYDQEQKANLN